MAITKRLARTPFLGPVGNRALNDGDVGSPVAFGPIFPKLDGNFMIDPILADHSSFHVQYDNQDPSKDKIVFRIAAHLIPPFAPFIGSIAPGFLAVDAATFTPRFEVRTRSTPEDFGQTDLPVPTAFFDDAIENPEPVFGRASWFSDLPIGGEQGQVIYQAGWNVNYSTIPISASHSATYIVQPFDKDGPSGANNIAFESADLVTPRAYDWAFFMGVGSQHILVLVNNITSFLDIYTKTGNTAASGRPEYDISTQYSGPAGPIRGLNWADARTLVGITKGIEDGPKTVFVWDMQTRRFTVSQLFWPEADPDDPLTVDPMFRGGLQISGFDARRSRIVGITGINVLDPNFATTFPNYVGNEVSVWSLQVLPSVIMEPIPKDTFRTGKTTVVFTKVIGSAGELMGTYRVKANITDPVLGRLKTSEGTTNGRGQASFSYVAPSLPSEAGAVPAIRVETNDVPGSF